MVHPGPHAPAHLEKRDAILEAALALFAERGFHGTAVPLVAERARVGAGTIYRYFRGKEDLVNALYQHWKLALLHEITVDFPFEAPAREQFHALWGRLATFARQHPSALKFLELHHHGEYLDERSRALEARALEPARAFLEASRAAQITKDVPSDVLIALVWGAFVRLVRASWEGQLELSAAVVDAAEACLWEAIRR